MRNALLLSCALGAMLLLGSTSRGDVAPSLPSTAPDLTPAPEATPEPITGTAISSTPPPNARPPHDPFTPYDIGPAPNDKSPKPFWSYNDLTPAERVVADRGRDTKGWDRIHRAFATAVAERAHQAASEAAEHQLGIDNLAGTGVVP